MSADSKRVPEISVICCYRDPKVWATLRFNIKRLSTGSVELIGVDNSATRYSLPQALNLGKQKASGDYLFFVHDDVLFVEENWDGVLLSIIHKLKNPGVLGFAGGTRSYCAPATWWTNEGQNRIIRNMNQRIEDGNDIEYRDSEAEKEVVGIDGFAFVVQREIIEDFEWSESIGLWHGYDLDLCYFCHYVLGKTNYVLPGPIIHHLSLGTLNHSWGASMIRLWVKYQGYLCESSEQRESLQVLKLFVNWTHSFELSKELTKAMERFGYRAGSILIVAMCYSRFVLVKRIGFKFLSLLSS